ncbi:phage minor head protein, partial [Treponema pedis]|uniref:phage minor head protein n=1 Tax=Treponema pedis TaxID=409322 RepID=UPI003D1C2C2A
ETWEDVKAIAEKNGSSFSPGYWETVYRTNTQSAYNAGRLMQYQNNPPPAWELLFIEDGRQSDICKGIAALVGNGKALSANHNFWSTYGFPPYHFNCRTTFRAVYDYEIGHGTEIVNTPMKQIRKNFKPQKGFGGNPIEKESWWRLTDKMKERIERYGIKKEVEAAAKSAGIDNFDVRLAHNELGQRRLQGTDFKANTIEGADPKPHEIEIAKILKENGYDVLFTPENTFIQGMKNPEGVITNLNRIVEMKKVNSEDIGKIVDKIKEAVKQQTEIVVLNFDLKTNYTKQRAIEEVKNAIHKTIPNEIDSVNQNRLTDKQKKSFEEKKTGIQKLKEVWLIWNGKISRIKK